MAKTAFVLGGTGQIGRAVTKRLAEGGWDVVIAARTHERLTPELRELATFVELDREKALDLPRAFDAFIDVVPYTRAHAEQLLRLEVGSIVAVSTASVYVDEGGRSLDEATDEESFPEFPVPIPETQATVEPGDATYSTQKVAMERTLLEQDHVPATIVRPGAIHGPGDSFTREWYFVKRVLDGRRVILLAHRGASRFHTSSAPNVAELIRASLERPGWRVLNCGDPDPPSVLEISRAIAREFGHDWTEHLVPGREIGTNPWAVPRPVILDTSLAERDVGYRPVVSYQAAVVETCRWLVDVRPPLGDYMERFFDYETEDRFLGVAP